MNRPAIVLALIILAAGWALAQEPQSNLPEFWKIGEEFRYEIRTHDYSVGHSTGHFVGGVKFGSGAEAYLFRTETIINRLTGGVSTAVSSELFTQSQGLPVRYTASYQGTDEDRRLEGQLGRYEFLFKEKKDTVESEFAVSLPGNTILCDRQSIPQWNLAFFNEKSLERDTLVFNVLIPYLRKRAVMKMARQADDTLLVLGQKTICKVFYSLRSDEYYFITPDKKVARVYLPKQALSYDLVSIRKVPSEKD